MSSRHVLALCAAAVFAAACSSQPSERSAASPTAPSIVAVADGMQGGVSGREAVDFPPRADGVEFRTQLENKYLAMGRRPSQVIVDMEGEATWVGEYYRYRVNGCDHDTATQRVMTQIDGASTGAGVLAAGLPGDRGLPAARSDRRFPPAARNEIPVDGPLGAVGGGPRWRGDLARGVLPLSHQRM